MIVADYVLQGDFWAKDFYVFLTVGTRNGHFVVLEALHYEDAVSQSYRWSQALTQVSKAN